MESPGSVHQLLVVGVARQEFEAAGRLFGLVGEVALALITGTARCAALLGAGPALPLGLLLLPPCEFLQRLHGLFELVTGLLALTALDGLVLVLELIEFEFEEIGEVIRSLAAATTTTTTLLPLTDLELIVLFSLLELQERSQLRRDRLLKIPIREDSFHDFHFGNGLAQKLRDLLEFGIVPDAAARQSLQ